MPKFEATLDKLKKLYEKNFKLLRLIPLLILLLSLGVLGYSKVTTGEFVSKDISLKGGLIITIETTEFFDIHELETALREALSEPVFVKRLKIAGSAEQFGYSFEVEKTTNYEEVLDAIRTYTGLELPDGSYTVEETSASLGGAFWTSTIKALLVAFLFMAIVVFYYFRNFVPSSAIVLAAAADLIGTLAIMDLLGIRLSTAGVAALLMLVGYSVDSDILLSTKVLKRTEGSFMERVYSAIKTGLTMESTTLAALAVIYVVSPSSVLKQIAFVLLLGLCLDVINTWFMNVGILDFYMKYKEGKNA